VNHSPRNFALAIGTAATLALGMGACAHPHHDVHVQTPAADYPDCDLGDLKQGDRDCNDPRAFADAKRKYGSKKVAAAQKVYADKQAKKNPKSVNTRVPGVTSTPKSTSTSKTSRNWNPFSKKTTKATPKR
jgi:hypothetical protein